jgi:hypothetical protein
MMMLNPKQELEPPANPAQFRALAYGDDGRLTTFTVYFI